MTSYFLSVTLLLMFKKDRNYKIEQKRRYYQSFDFENGGLFTTPCRYFVVNASIVGYIFSRYLNLSLDKILIL